MTKIILKADRVTEPEITPYVKAFYLAGKSRGLDLDLSHISLIFESIDETDEDSMVKTRTIGRCYPISFLNDDLRSYIVIDPDYWKRADPDTKEALVFHELGHCILHRYEHTNEVAEDIFGNEFPVSLMNYLVVEGDIYAKNRKYYQDELFAKLPSTVKLKYFVNNPFCADPANCTPTQETH